MNTSSAVTAVGETNVVSHSVMVKGVIGYFDQPTNTATLPIITIYDAATTDVSSAPVRFTFQPSHEKNKEYGDVISITFPGDGLLFTKGVTVSVGAFAESTGEIRIIHD